jgi:pyruvate/2-oxoglutarate dehydrogenase complex dihydrolipoamide acyltransferase (E2) component
MPNKTRFVIDPDRTYVVTLDDGDEVKMPASMTDMSQVSPLVDPAVAAAISPPDEEGKVTLDLDAITVTPSPLDNQFELNNESIKLINPIVKKVNAATALKVESKIFQLNESVEKFIGASVAVKKTINYQHKILEMVSEVESLYEYLQEVASNLQDKGVYEGRLEKLYKQLNKLVEQYNMKKNLKTLTEAEITLKLTNVPDEVVGDLDDLGVDLVADEEDSGEEAPEGDDDEGGEELDLGDEEGSEDDTEEEELDLSDEEENTEEMQKMESRLRDNTIVEIDENMLRKEISRMRSLREADETKPQSWGNGPGDVSSEEDFETDDLGDPFLDIDLSETQDLQTEDDGDEGWWKLGIDSGFVTADQAKEMKGMIGETDMDELDQMMQGQDQKKQGQDQKKQGTQKEKQEEADDKKVQEARRHLAREARIQTEAKKKAQTAKKQQKEAQKKAQQKQQETQQKMKQKKQQEAQKAKQEAQKQAKQAKKMQEAYVYYANIFNESVRRTAKLQSVLAESRNVVRRNGAATRSTAETSTLRKKLAETNLFNTKLLYCNKLLQNESFTKRQKAEMIERLDEANSEREVKLVYESLVKTLGNSSSKSLSEGTQRVLGSSSQATRAASTVISEGYEADRWAKLAGLK